MLLLWGGYWIPRTEKAKVIRKPVNLTEAKQRYYLGRKVRKTHGLG